jgi:hypothetical protein
MARREWNVAGNGQFGRLAKSVRSQEPARVRGKQPRCMSLIWFQRNPLPLDWIEQRRVVDGFDA